MYQDRRKFFKSITTFLSSSSLQFVFLFPVHSPVIMEVDLWLKMEQETNTNKSTGKVLDINVVFSQSVYQKLGQ